MAKFTLFLVTLFFSLNLSAQTQSWTVGQTSDKVDRYAITLNDSNGALRQRCNIEDEKCYWSLMIVTKCTSGETFPVLVSSDLGASHLQLYCGSSFKVSNDLYYEYYFNEFEAIDKLVRSSKSIGIAMALESGSFRVVRFLMNDAIVKVDQMRALTTADIEKKKKKSTKDSIL